MKLSPTTLLSTLLGSALGAYILGRCTAGAYMKHTSGSDRNRSSSDEASDPFHRSNQRTMAGATYASLSILPDGTSTPHEQKQQHHTERNASVTRVTAGVCQNLFFDMDVLNVTFLQSEEQIITAMMDILNFIDTSIVLTEPYCHRLPAARLSCELLQSQSHLRLYSWPQSGVLCLNLFSCQDDSLVELVPQLTQLFRPYVLVDQFSGSILPSRIQWAHKERGHSPQASADASGDIGHFLQGWMEFDMKQLVHFRETDYQTIEIYDVINPRFRSLEQFRASLTQGTYESLHPELYRPDRIVYMDGIMQSRYYGDAAYHEALVHPAMFTHPHPKRVAIIGGGEGATLREVLKHNTVETVTMIEIDAEMVQVAKEYLREWNDCSNIAGSTKSCFDDPRAEILCTDAVAWFMEHFRDDGMDASPLQQRYDVVIMDALDPSSEADFSDVLYGNDNFIRSLSNSLNADGILVAQLGEDMTIEAPGARFTSKIQAKTFVEHLKHLGFQRIESYSEAHGFFLAPWGYMIAFKRAESSFSRWHANQAMIDREIHRRSVASVDGSPDNLFRVFDGATLMGYQYPTRVAQELFCRDSPMPVGCDRGHGLNPELPHTSIEAIVARSSTVQNISSGLFSTQYIQKDSYLAVEATSQNVVVMPSTAMLMMMHYHKELGRNFPFQWNIFGAFLRQFGYKSSNFGGASFLVHFSVLLFLNRRCHDITLENSISDVHWNPVIHAANIFFRRNHLSLQPFTALTNRDISAGEEILSSDIGLCKSTA